MKSLSEFTGFIKHKPEMVDLDNVNDQLTEVTEDCRYPDVWSAIETITQIAKENGLNLPLLEDLEDEEFGEEVFQLDEEHFLYFCYMLDEETNEYETVSGIFTEEELEEILAE